MKILLLCVSSSTCEHNMKYMLNSYEDTTGGQEADSRGTGLHKVFSDGHKDTQHQPYSPGEQGMFWPVLIPEDVAREILEGRVIVILIPTWCQAQVISESRPYLSHPSRIFLEEIHQGPSYPTAQHCRSCHSKGPQGSSTVKSEEVLDGWELVD